VAEAKRHGWLCYHTYDSRRCEPGFPDWVFIRERVLWVELKSADGKVSIKQAKWGAALVRAGQTWVVWRPADWQTIVTTLGG
jgi:hypothetical protein